MQKIIEFIQIFGFALVAAELFFLIAEARKTRDANRKMATLDYLTAHFDTYNTFRSWLDGFPEARLSDPGQFTSEERDRISSYLRMMERMSVGIGQGMFSFDYVSNVANKNIRRNFVALKPYIDALREERQSQKIYDAFEWLSFELERYSDERVLPEVLKPNGVFSPKRDFLRIHSR